MAPSSTGPALPTPPAGVDLDAEFVNITPERFTSVPLSSHRDGPHRLTSLLALGVLTLYLSHRTGWKIPNAETLARQWSEGADRIRTAIADIERAGFLVRFRVQGERGRWFTRTFVSADPASLEPIRRYAAALEAAYAAAKASKAGKSGKASKTNATTSKEDTFSQVAPDGGFRDSVGRDSDDRHSVTGHLNRETNRENQKENPPLPPRGTTTTPAGGKAATGGNFDEQTRAILNAAVDAAAKERAGADGWKLSQIRAAVRAALAAGHSPELVARRLIEIAADHEGTAFPARLPKLLDAEAAETTRRAAAAPAETPPWAEGAVKYIDPDRPKCRKHPGNPEDNCGPCRVDAQVAAVEAADNRTTSNPLPDPKAAALAVAKAARQSSRTRRVDRRPVVPRQATPDTPPPAEPAAEQGPELVGAAS